MEILRPRPATDARTLERFLDLSLEADGLDLGAIRSDAEDMLEFWKAATRVLGWERANDRVAVIEGALQQAPRPRPVSLRPQPRRLSLSERVRLQLNGTRWPALLVLVGGRHEPRDVEPFRTMGPVFGEDVPLLVTEGFGSHAWEGELEVLANELRLTSDQRTRARRQAFDDGRVEVLFIHNGQVMGSTLVPVARAKAGQFLGFDVKVQVMSLLDAARGVGMPGFDDLCLLGRDALGMPAGSLSKMRRPARRLRFGAEAPRATAGIAVEEVTILRRGESIPTIDRNAGRPATNAPTAAAPRPIAKAKPEERHVIEGGTCKHCGKTGKALEGVCSRADNSRIALLELD